MIEIGRVCLKIAGRDAGLNCVIIDILDNNFVMIDGQTRRRKCNIKHLEPLDKVLKIKKGASQSEVESAFKKELHIEIVRTKPKKAGEKPVRQRLSKKPMEEQAGEKKSEKSAKESTKESKPKADLKKLMKSGKTQIPDWFMKYYLPQERQTEIIDEILDKHNINKQHIRGKWHAEILLGASPSTINKNERGLKQTKNGTTNTKSKA